MHTEERFTLAAQFDLLEIIRSAMLEAREITFILPTDDAPRIAVLVKAVYPAGDVCRMEVVTKRPDDAGTLRNFVESDRSEEKVIVHP